MARNLLSVLSEVLATFPQMIGRLPRGTLEMRGSDNLLPLHRAVACKAPAEVVTEAPEKREFACIAKAHERMIS